MLKWLRALMFVLFLLLAIGTAVFAIRGYRNGLCAYWTRSDQAISNTQYWQIDSVGGRLQLLRLDSFSRTEALQIRHAEKNWNATGPLSGAAIVARFKSGSFDIPGLLLESGNASAFPSFTGTLVITSSTTRPSVTLSSIGAGGVVSFATTGVSQLQVTGSSMTTTTASPTSITVTGPAAISARGSGTLVLQQTSTSSGQLSVAASSVTLSGVTSGSGKVTGVIKGANLSITPARGNSPYIFWSVNAVAIILLLLLPVLIETRLLFRRRSIRAYRLRNDYCLTCGYDLKGAPHVRCPECGTERIAASVPAQMN
jgi:hypothetical protein